MLAQVQVAKESNNIYPLAEKLLNAKKNQIKGDPFKKDEFTSLRDIALDVVAANFHLYPSLENVPPRLKTIVFQKHIFFFTILIQIIFYLLRSLKKQAKIYLLH